MPTLATRLIVVRRHAVIFTGILILGACSDPTISDPHKPLVEQIDSVGAYEARYVIESDPEYILLTDSAELRITLLERNASWFHALYVELPEDTLLAGPGYLFPGPTFDVGPYPPGEVLLRLDAYNPNPPHPFIRTAAAQVTGSYPSWIVGFEDGFDSDFDDIVVRVDIIPHEIVIASLECSPTPVTRAEIVECRVTLESQLIQPQDVEYEWNFQGDSIRVFPAVDAAPFGLPSPIDTVATGLDAWIGPAVLEGDVFVRATWQSTVDSATTRIDIEARQGSIWGDLPHNLAPDTVDIPTDSTVGLALQPSPFPGDTVTGLVGLNIDSIDRFTGDQMIRGLPVTETVDSGPNRGLAYITHPGDVRTTRAVALRTWLSGREAPKFDYHRVPGVLLSHRALMQAMRSTSSGNQSKFGQDSAAFFQGVFAHETYGQGGGRGHQGQIELAAASLATCGRVPTILERVVGVGAVDALATSGIVLEQGRRSLYAAMDHDHVHSNFGTVPAYEVVSQVTAVTHSYPHVNVGGDVPQPPSFDSAPDPLYKCTRVYP